MTVKWQYRWADEITDELRLTTLAGAREGFHDCSRGSLFARHFESQFARHLK